MQPTIMANIVDQRVANRNIGFVWNRRTGLSGGLDAEASARVERLIDQTGISSDALTSELATTASLAEGRKVLLNHCVAYHDLRTAIVRPRKPSD